MNEQQHTPTVPITSREQALELEVARLTAELEALRGDDPTAVTSRFLAMAAATVDQAVEDARREADELAEEISAEAEARRDQAARLAAEAEAKAERLQLEAANAQEIVDDAHQQAEAIRVAALDEATERAAAERERIEAELNALTEVRTALDAERAELESYHEELSRRVQDMAESMMAFMTTEPPILSGLALDAPTAPALVRDASEDETAEPEDDDPVAEVDETADEESPAEEPETPPSPFAVPVAPVASSDDAWLEEDLPDDPGFTEALAGAIGADGDEIADAEPAANDAFAGVPVVDDEVDASSAVEGLFGSAAGAEASPNPAGSLFGAHGARHVEQTPPSALADALEDDGTETDEAFREFLTGDGEPDPSRDWLLRPEQS